MAITQKHSTMVISVVTATQVPAFFYFKVLYPQDISAVHDFISGCQTFRCKSEVINDFSMVTEQFRSRV